MEALSRALTTSPAGDGRVAACAAWHGKGGEIMFNDRNLVFAWFGFIFLMFLFKASFVARLIGASLSRGVLHAQLMHRRGSADGHGVHGPGSAHPQVQA
jgi:hypothetical protein